MITKDTQFLIVGLGLLGGSYAMGLKKKGYHVEAIECKQESIDYALSHHIIDRGALFDEDMIGKADMIICGLYPTMMIEWIHQNQRYMKPHALISDVCGVKRYTVSHIQEQLREDLEFLGSHPMAGKEVSGVQYADNTIFHDANFIITPTLKNSEIAIKQVEELAHILEFANISTLSIEKHDEMVGFVSQLAHAIAVSLMNMSDNSHLVEYTGDSFRDLTRIAKINEQLWTELFFLNKDLLIREIDAFVHEMNHLKDTLIVEDEEALKALFIRSTKRRKQFDR